MMVNALFFELATRLDEELKAGAGVARQDIYKIYDGQANSRYSVQICF